MTIMLTDSLMVTLRLRDHIEYHYQCLDHISQAYAGLSPCFLRICPKTLEALFVLLLSICLNSLYRTTSEQPFFSLLAAQQIR